MEDITERTLNEKELDQVAGGSTVKEKKWVTYMVIEGDSLTSIARMYDCTVADLKIWNPKCGSDFSEGMSLRIYTINY